MADDEKKPVFDISIGTSAMDSRVKVNGDDISGSIRGCTVECMAGGLSKITLFVLGPNARVTVQAAIGKREIEIVTDGENA